MIKSPSFKQVRSDRHISPSILPSCILKTLDSPSELVFNDFRKLRNDVHQLANKFRAEFGIKSGDRICAYSSNTYETAGEN